MNLKSKALIAAMAATFALTGTAFAGGVTYKDGDKYVKMGGRIQLQYVMSNPGTGDSTDQLLFRRFRPYIEGSTHAGWKGKFQFDLGNADGSNEVAVKDAYMQYKGFENMKLTIGNAKSTFSREALTSSKKQQLVERTFVGDHNYGSLDRTTGIHLTGHTEGKNIEWATQVAVAAVDPDATKLDFDSVANDAADWNQGFVFGARVDYHPFGLLKKSQGDFKGEQKATIGIGVFTWNNDGDVEGYPTKITTTTIPDTSTGAAPGDTLDVVHEVSDTGKPALDRVTGIEISVAYRNAGFSLDAQYNTFEADTVDATHTGGIYQNGSTTLSNWAVEGGYMIVAKTLEIAAGYQVQDADGYATEWKRTSVGLNYYVAGHDIKFQLTHRMGEGKDGKTGSAGDLDETFLQAQYVF